MNKYFLLKYLVWSGSSLVGKKHNSPISWLVNIALGIRFDNQTAKEMFNIIDDSIQVNLTKFNLDKRNINSTKEFPKV